METMIFEHKSFTSDEYPDVVVFAKVPHAPDVQPWDLPPMKFHGMGQTPIDERAMAQFEFEIDGPSLEDAFRNYNQAYASKKEIVEAEIEENRRKAKLLTPAMPKIQRAVNHAVRRMR